MLIEVQRSIVDNQKVLCQNAVACHFERKPAVKPQAKYLAPRFTRGSGTSVEMTDDLSYRAN